MSKQTRLVFGLVLIFSMAATVIWLFGRTALRDATAEAADSNVTCQAVLIAVEQEYPWFEDGGADIGIDDGVSPLARFRIEQPVEHSPREIAVLFKYETAANAPVPSTQQIGQNFTLELPAHFLAGEYQLINNIDVRQIALD